MAVERLTDYTRRIWTALGPDDPAGHDIHVNDVIYYMDSSECCIVSNVYPDGTIDCETLPDIGGGGGGSLDIMQYVIQRGQSINAAITAAAVPVKYPNEILIWNIIGDRKQASGSIAGKWGFQVVQNGTPVNLGGWYQRASNVAPPDDLTPSTNMSGFNMTIVDGVFRAPGGTTFNVGVGNVIEFVQIPYNINWGV